MAAARDHCCRGRLLGGPLRARAFEAEVAVGGELLAVPGQQRGEAATLVQIEPTTFVEWRDSVDRGRRIEKILDGVDGGHAQTRARLHVGHGIDATARV
jgi:hypothetical protein